MSNKWLKIFFVASLFLVVLIGFITVRYQWNLVKNKQIDKVLMTAKIAESLLSTEDIAQLDANDNDLNQPEYIDIKKSLMDLVRIDSEIIFAYLYAQKNDKIYFLVDSEPVSSADYSPPGQEYSEASYQDKLPFTTFEPLITEPTSDRWGRWVSVLVPVINDNNEVIAIFGLDYSADTWYSEEMRETIRVALYFVFLLLLIFSFYRIILRNRSIKENEAKFHAFLNSSQDAVIALNGAKKVILWNKSAQKIFSYTASELMDQELNKFLDFRTDVKNKVNFLESIYADNTKSGESLVSLSVKNKDGRLIFVELSYAKVTINNNLYFIFIIRDITKRKTIDDLLKKSIDEKNAIITESDRLNKLMIGRELEMIKLKKKILELNNQLNNS